MPSVEKSNKSAMAGSERKRTFPRESNSRNYANRTIKQERRIMFTIEREK